MGLVQGAGQVRFWERPATSRSEERREFAGRSQKQTRSPEEDLNTSSDGDRLAYLNPRVMSRVCAEYSEKEK